MAFDFINFQQETADWKKYHISRFILHPDQWQAYPNRVKLEWKEVKFDAENKALLPPDKKGIYSFIVQPGIVGYPLFAYPLYVGMTEKQSFRDRYQQYLREHRKSKPRWHICSMLNNWSEHLYFVYAPIEDNNIIKKIEADLLSALLPPMNRNFPAKIQPFVNAVLNQ